MPSGGVSPLDTVPGLREFVAEVAVAGHTAREIGELVGQRFPALGVVSRGTIGRWLRDPGVAAMIERLGRERTNDIVRSIDAELFAKIQTPASRAQLDIKTLLDIRKELLPPAPQRHILHRGTDEAAATSELWLRLSQDPDLAERLGIAASVPALEEGNEYDD